MLKPMKGKMINKLPKSYSVNYPVLASIKYDGRYTQIYQKDKELVFCSSGGKEFKLELPNDTKDCLMQLTKNNEIIEAELIYNDGKLGGRAKTGIQLTWITNTAKGIKNIIPSDYEFVIFNVIDASGIKCNRLINEDYYIPHLTIINQTLLSTENEVECFLDTVLAKGYEGIVCVEEKKSKIYKPGKRVNFITKHKQIKEAIVKVVGFNEGTGKYEGYVGSLICEYKGNTINVGSGLTDEHRVPIIDFFDFIDYNGEYIEIEFESLYNGIPQQPVFKRFVNDRG